MREMERQDETKTEELVIGGLFHSTVFLIGCFWGQVLTPGPISCVRRAGHVTRHKAQ